MRDTYQTGPYHRHMTNTEASPTRTLTIVLPESDWRALRAAEPDAVAWLQERIRERLATEASSGSYVSPAGPTADSWFADDEY
jgi:hypothetical protein